DGCFGCQVVAAVHRGWRHDDDIHDVGQVAVLNNRCSARYDTPVVSGGADAAGHALNVRVANDQVAGHVIGEPDAGDVFVRVGQDAGVAAGHEAVDDELIRLVTEDSPGVVVPDAEILDSPGGSLDCFKICPEPPNRQPTGHRPVSLVPGELEQRRCAHVHLPRLPGDAGIGALGGGHPDRAQVGGIDAEPVGVDF